MIPKFRAWDKMLNKMTYSVVIPKEWALRQVQIDILNMYDNLSERYIFMQSTGLKDKNGVEIFEGDILTDEGDFGHDFWDYGEVVFDRDEYTYLIEWKSENVCESITNCGDYSIAGNIYENKELLED